MAAKAKEKVTRWVCDVCKAPWFSPSATDRCPSCGGTGREREVERREDGSIALTD